MTRIWYVSKYVATPGRGRAGGRGYFLMKELATLGYNVSIITSDSNRLAEPPVFKQSFHFESVDNLLLCWVKTLKYLKANSYRRILSWLHFEWRLLFLPVGRLGRPDLIIVSSLSLLTIINGMYWRYRFKCALIFEVRDIWPLTLVEEGGFHSNNPLIKFLAFIEKKGYEKSDAVVGTMPNLKEHVHAVINKSRKVFCIPMGISDEDISVSSDSAPIYLDYFDKIFPKDRFVIGYVGTIGITNALETFFETVASLEDNNDIAFVVVGDGDLKVNYIERYGHLRNLFFAPSVPKDQVQSVLGKFDVLYFSTFPSLIWRFGQSLNKIIDYMAAGKPVIGSYSGYPSMINDAHCGTFVPAGNVELLKSEFIRYSKIEQAELKIIGENGAIWLKKNRSYSKLGQMYNLIIRDVLVNKGKD